MRPITPTHWRRFIIWPGKITIQVSTNSSACTAWENPLYEQVTGKVADGKLNRPCRIYAPVGTHETLLAYLVRRLLENGANTSFVNRIADATLPLDELVADPVEAVEKLAQQEGQAGIPHPKNSAAARSVRRRSDKLRRT
ncbi:trifunctional transcriptional regulator/proline dehydrogenase/pyrroline-5-carboxylate dehydrogenase [Salmonella enterica subsp. arizonae]|uniref:Trifunctional transcriptional regulator/proline dehydrogenase/pyrroline-5-carboxylate dehydrogenase n=1 Tax=Salmonella enterica subsp. arizonae TaxID=59203 RepID=A0A379SWK2_SALER|nr:trifunctional transcriptional regulator/proline dehydrogenase/pyrroline-5-carboxylate dehydrogenase [Salmonella enterica subsp. arizonae]